MSGSGISWAVCKSAPRSRQITTPVPHHSVFYTPDALLAAQPTASKHWRHNEWIIKKLLLKFTHTYKHTRTQARTNTAFYWTCVTCVQSAETSTTRTALLTNTLSNERQSEIRRANSALLAAMPFGSNKTQRKMLLAKLNPNHQLEQTSHLLPDD